MTHARRRPQAENESWFPETLLRPQENESGTLRPQRSRSGIGQRAVAWRQMGIFLEAALPKAKDATGGTLICLVRRIECFKPFSASIFHGLRCARVCRLNTASEPQAAWRRHRCRRAAKAAQRQIFDARLADVAKAGGTIGGARRGRTR